MWWNKDSEGEFEIIPDGQYTAFMDDATLDETKTPSKLSVKFKLVKNTAHNNRTVWMNFTFSEKTVKFLQWQLGELGAWTFVKEVDDESKVPRVAAEHVFKLVKAKQHVVLELSSREYQGKQYQNVIIKQVIDRPGDVPVPQEPVDFGELKNEAPTAFDPNEKLPF